MKLKNLLIFGVVMFAVSVMFSSCEKEITDIYHYRVEYMESNSKGKQIVSDYLYEQGVFTGDRGFTSERTADNDNKARDLFDANAVKIKRAVLKDLLDSRPWIDRTRVTFIYEVVTGNSVTGFIRIESREYVIEPKL
ncbi:hypothetical protein FACS189440_15780 [Bacteroidia bacterium]|nr:hypothetical protein FACS189440_15780 [Bacteroidia bacterium]